MLNAHCMSMHIIPICKICSPSRHVSFGFNCTTIDDSLLILYIYIKLTGLCWVYS